MKIKDRLLLTHGLLVLLALIIVIVNAMSYQAMKNDSAIVNDLGRLRGLSYNMGRIASELDNSDNENDSVNMRKELLLRIDEFKNTLARFERKKVMKDTGVRADLGAIDRKWHRLFEPVYKKIIDNTATDTEYQLISDNINSYVKEINNMVTAYSDYAGKKVYDALGINAVLVIVLALAAIYSFRTMNSHVRKPILLLMNELKELSNIDDEFARQLYRIDVDEITEMAQHFNIMIFDQLTLAYNRRSGLSRLKQMMGEENRRQLGLSLCFVDINGLKEVNDNLGHKFGDELIVTTAGCIKAGIRENDFVIRMGGDEFLIVLSGIGAEEAEMVWGRISGCFKTINESEGRSYEVSASHGIAEYNSAERTGLEDLIKEADEKMYAEKKTIKEALKAKIIKQST
ncbi:hypothetical protein MASR2M70_09020 [Bacillota bacterium]